ncbi:MAG TPA: Gfo/Idh/MocA family oxidoreductase [Clostridiales bacterium]|nr:Gfo/Idh/MocA family oxidoreductase [Clostridiales bacterium]
MVKVVFVGVGGYGDLYLTLYNSSDRYAQKMEIAAVVDPYVEKAAKYEWIKQRQIPVFNTLEDFFKENSADLVIISTPLQLHKQQCVIALKNGANVLCEKPLVPVVQDLIEIEEAQKSSGKRLGVGFQWSFSKTMTGLKSDILKGRFGKPLELKSLICWKRFDDYYSSSTWKGKLKDRNGNWILDSVVTNATAHYLHNIFFVLGSRMDAAAMPVQVRAEVYRAKPIESFDTVVLSGGFENGAKFWYGATHSGDLKDVTKFLYRFEKADICFNIDKIDDHVYANFHDGKVVDYGNPQSFEELHPKFMTMIDACINPDTVIPCCIETIKPHLKVCNGLFGVAGINNIPKDLIFETGEPKGVFARRVQGDMQRLFETMQLPYEAGCSWASPFTTFRPEEITQLISIKENKR